MYLNEEAEIWVKKQVESSIVGNCCSLANEIHFKEDYKNLKEFKSFLKVIFLLKNFNEILSHNDIVDNHFSKKANQNQWYSSKDRFKVFIEEAMKCALIEIRESKLEKIL